MSTSSAPTLAEARAVVQRLSHREKTQLLSELAQELTSANIADTPTARPGEPSALVAAMRELGPWEGDDLEQRLADVYAVRVPLRFTE